jgi:hypothetical protein
MAKISKTLRSIDLPGECDMVEEWCSVETFATVDKGKPRSSWEVIFERDRSWFGARE